MQRHPEGCDPSSYRAYASHRKPRITRERAWSRASWDPALVTLPGMQTALRELERLGPSLYRGTIPRHNLDRLANDLTSILLTHVNQIRAQPKRPSLVTPSPEAVNEHRHSYRKGPTSKMDHDQPASASHFQRTVSHVPMDNRGRSVHRRHSLQDDVHDTVCPKRRRHSYHYDRYESGAHDDSRRPPRPYYSKEIRRGYEYIPQHSRHRESRREWETEEAQETKLPAQAVESSDESKEAFLKIARPKLYVSERPLESDYASLTPLSMEPDDDTDIELYTKWNAGTVRKVGAHDAQASSNRQLCPIFPLGKNRLVFDMLVDVSLMRRAAAVGEHTIINANVLQRLPLIPSRCLVPGGWDVRDLEQTQSVRRSLTKAKTSNMDPNRPHELPPPNHGGTVPGEKLVNEKVHVSHQTGSLPSNNRVINGVPRNVLVVRPRSPVASLIGTRTGQGSGFLNAGSGEFPHAALTSTQTTHANRREFTSDHVTGMNQSTVDNYLHVDGTNPLRPRSEPERGIENMQLALNLGHSNRINTQFQPDSRHGISQGPTRVMERPMLNVARMTPHGVVPQTIKDHSQIGRISSADQMHSSAMYGHYPCAEYSKCDLARDSGRLSRSEVYSPHPNQQPYGFHARRQQYHASGPQHAYHGQLQNRELREHRGIEIHKNQHTTEEYRRKYALQTQQGGLLERRLPGQDSRLQPGLTTAQLTKQGRQYQQMLQQQRLRLQGVQIQSRLQRGEAGMKHNVQFQNLTHQGSPQYPIQLQQNHRAGSAALGQSRNTPPSPQFGEQVLNRDQTLHQRRVHFHGVGQNANGQFDATSRPKHRASERDASRPQAFSSVTERELGSIHSKPSLSLRQNSLQIERNSIDILKNGVTMKKHGGDGCHSYGANAMHMAPAGSYKETHPLRVQRTGGEKNASQPLDESVEQLKDQLKKRQRQYEKDYKTHYELQLRKVMTYLGKKPFNSGE